MSEQSRQEKLPFYMTFPMQNLYRMEQEYERDLERMKSLYPAEVARILPVIEERCDELEYEGSRIYDEEPDAQMLREEAQRLYERIRRELGGDAGTEAAAGSAATDASVDRSRGETPFALNPPVGFALPMPDRSDKGTDAPEMTSQETALAGASLAGQQMFSGRPPQGPGRPPQGPGGAPCGDNWLCSMVGILLQNELYRRRCRYRRCHRWW